MMGGAHNGCGRDYKCIQNISGKPRGRDNFYDGVIDNRIIQVVRKKNTEEHIYSLLNHGVFVLRKLNAKSVLGTIILENGQHSTTTS
jgi:hypothetical protein